VHARASSSPSLPTRNGLPPSPLIDGETPLLASAARLGSARSASSVSDGPAVPPTFHASLQRRLHNNSSTLSAQSPDSSAPMFAFALSQSPLRVPPRRDAVTTPSAVSIHSAAPARDMFELRLELPTSRSVHDGAYYDDDDDDSRAASEAGDGADQFDDTASGSSGSSHLADVFRSHPHPFGSGR